MPAIDRAHCHRISLMDARRGEIEQWLEIYCTADYSCQTLTELLSDGVFEICFHAEADYLLFLLRWG